VIKSDQCLAHSCQCGQYLTTCTPCANHYRQIGRSGEFIEQRLKKKLRLYVETEQLKDSQQALKKNNFLIITGDPGSGKTAMAELLVYTLIKDDYEPILQIT
jgi:DNA replication protein DnaC